MTLSDAMKSLAFLLVHTLNASRLFVNAIPVWSKGQSSSPPQWQSSYNPSSSSSSQSMSHVNNDHTANNDHLHGILTHDDLESLRNLFGSPSQNTPWPSLSSPGHGNHYSIHQENTFNYQTDPYLLSDDSIVDQYLNLDAFQDQDERNQVSQMMHQNMDKYHSNAHYYPWQPNFNQDQESNIYQRQESLHDQRDELQPGSTPLTQQQHESESEHNNDWREVIAPDDQKRIIEVISDLWGSHIGEKARLAARRRLLDVLTISSARDVLANDEEVIISLAARTAPPGRGNRKRTNHKGQPSGTWPDMEINDIVRQDIVKRLGERWNRDVPAVRKRLRRHYRPEYRPLITSPDPILFGQVADHIDQVTLVGKHNPKLQRMLQPEDKEELHLPSTSTTSNGKVDVERNPSLEEVREGFQGPQLRPLIPLVEMIQRPAIYNRDPWQHFFHQNEIDYIMQTLQSKWASAHPSLMQRAWKRVSSNLTVSNAMFILQGDQTRINDLSAWGYPKTHDQKKKGKQP